MTMSDWQYGYFYYTTSQMPCREPFHGQAAVGYLLNVTKTGTPASGHILSGCGLLVNLSTAAFLSAHIAAVPGASNIDSFETRHKSRFTHLHSTLLPQVTGQRNRRRLASPLHGTLTPGRISVGRPLSGSRTGVSLSLTESSQNSLPRTAFGRMGTAGHLTFRPL